MTIKLSTRSRKYFATATRRKQVAASSFQYARQSINLQDIINMMRKQNIIYNQTKHLYGINPSKPWQLCNRLKATRFIRFKVSPRRQWKKVDNPFSSPYSILIYVARYNLTNEKPTWNPKTYCNRSSTSAPLAAGTGKSLGSLGRFV